jgi:hypothetical protein
LNWYKTGTITVTNGSPTITGAGTLWVDTGTLFPGDILYASDGKLYEILTINSNTGITLASNYLGTSLSGQAYSIMPIGLLPSTLAQQVKSTLATANTALASAVRYDINSMGLSLTQQQNARTNIAALSALDVGAGRLSKSVAGGVDVTLTAAEASAQFIELTGTITANINVIVPAAARLFYVYNGTSGAFTVTIKTPSGSGVIVPNLGRMMLECDATNVVNPLTTFAGNVSAAGFFGTGSAITYLSDQTGVNYVRINGSTASPANTVQIYSNNVLGLTQDAAQNIGLGVFPSAWSTVTPVIELKNGVHFACINSTTPIAYLGANAYYNGTNWIYKNTGWFSARYEINSSGNGSHAWFTAPNGTAGNPISGANAFVQVMTLDAIGNLLVGTTSGGSGKLVVQSSDNFQTAYFPNTNTTASGAVGGLYVNYTGATPNNSVFDFFRATDSTSVRVKLLSNGGLANFSANNVNLSDVRTKKDIFDSPSYLDRICAIPVRTFLYKDQTDTQLNLGVIAQEVEEHCPELVSNDGFGDIPEDGIPLKTIYQTDLQYALMKCIQEQQALIDSHEARLTAAGIA